MSFVPTFIFYNTILQIPIWWFLRRDRKDWNFFLECAQIHLYFLMCISIGFVMHLFLLLSDAFDSYAIKFVFFFVSFYLGHLLSLLGVKVISKLFFNDQPYFTAKRSPEPSIPQLLYHESIQAFVDAIGYLFMYYFTPFELHEKVGRSQNYMELSIASILFSPVSDFIFYFLHGVILHGPLWSFHRGHHQIYKPTTTSGRDFDALDWFFEFTIPVIVPHVIMCQVSQAQETYDPLWNTIIFAAVIMFSMMHHCGKEGYPNSPSPIIPWLESFPVMLGCTINGLHEGHHNWVNYNFGSIGIADTFFGTMKQPKRAKKDA